MSRRAIAQLATFVVVSVIVFATLWSGDGVPSWNVQGWALRIAIALGAGILALILMPFVVLIPYHWMRDQIRRAEASDLVAAALGLVVGLIIAALLAIPLSQLRLWNLGSWLPTIAALLFAWLGVAAAVLRKDEFARLFSSAFGRGRRSRDEEEHREDEEEHREEERGRLRFGKRSRAGERILVDTSSIIDGRIADISQTGFIPGALVVPRFVLEELQHIADSPDSMRRNRGRRGLEVLQRLQKEATVPVEISDADPTDVPEVDAKLVKLARQWKALIITNDFNLNRVAELQGVKVLNINELAHAVKPILLPGEELAVKIMQDGKEIGQGVGYLDDGTMIVVENGKSYIGNTIDVTVTRVLQTVAGRMIFAQPKQPSGNVPQRRMGTA
ncbi:MAG TPA: TRAM domain-containing protein [Ktedonobacterales bacterium]